MKHLLLIITLCSFALISCNSEPAENPTLEAQLKITSQESYSVEYEGGEITITYEVVNPIEEVILVATPSEEWITEVAASEGSIVFAIGENSSDNTRNASIKLSYDKSYKEVHIEQHPAPTFELIGETTLEVDAKGGNIEIAYEWSRTPREELIEVTSSVDWVVVNDVNEHSTIVEVAENSTSEPRSTTLSIAYLDTEHTVTINQAASEVVIPEDNYIELPYLSGIYFGNQYGATENDFNYSLVMSNRENCLDIITGDVTLLENSTYLFLDLYASEPAERLNISFDIPMGEYSLDTTDSAVSGTIGYSYSSLYITNEIEGTEIFFVDGSVSVTTQGIEAILYDKEGNKYHYFTAVSEVDNSDNFGPAWTPEEQSTLNGDLDVEFAEGAIYAECYGDYYVIGKNTWIYFVDDTSTGDSFCFELLADVDAEYPVGTFPVTNDLNNEQMALPGYVNGDGNVMWSWYSLYNDNNDVISAAPIVDGEIVITESGNDTFTVRIDVVDDLGNSLTGECIAYGEFYGTRSQVVRHTLSPRK
jgi:hypothetical protein